MANAKRTTPSKKPSAKAPVVAVAPKPLEEARRKAVSLAELGGGEMAYIRAFRAAELRHVFPQAAELHPAVQLFALFGADGTPLMLADSRDAVLSGAWEHELALQSVN